MRGITQPAFHAWLARASSIDILCVECNPQPVKRKGRWEMNGVRWAGESVQFTEEELRSKVHPPVEPGEVAYIKERWKYKDGTELQEFEYQADKKEYDPQRQWCSAESMPEEAARTFFRVEGITLRKGPHYISDEQWRWDISLHLTDKEGNPL